MNKEQYLVCIVCPRGCRLKVDGELNVTGHGCIRGVKYAHEELTDPRRMVPTTVKLLNSALKRLPVITSAPIPKNRMLELMEYVHKAEIAAPVRIHQVIISDPLGLGIDIISTRTVEGTK